MNLGDKISQALRPDAQGFDEVRIITVPRYKQSGLSGDEWRISGLIKLLRKGVVVHEESFRDVETAAKFLPFVMGQALDSGKGYFAGEDGKCDQEGCQSEPIHYFRIKKKFCCGYGGCGQEEQQFGAQYRKFCEEHKTRGDCGLEDADDNYEEIQKP